MIDFRGNITLIEARQDWPPASAKLDRPHRPMSVDPSERRLDNLDDSPRPALAVVADCSTWGGPELS